MTLRHSAAARRTVAGVGRAPRCADSCTGTYRLAGLRVAAAEAGPPDAPTREGRLAAYLFVLVPFGYGLYQLLIKIPVLFGH